MKNKYFALLLVLFLLPISYIFAQEVVFIPGGEVEGIKISSFYLSIKPISNQDYFLFMQFDGYRKKIWWEEEDFNKRDKYKNAQGDYAPRSWNESNPPMGEEYNAVLGISKAEAKAYANYIDWLLPTEKMWQLAQKVRPSIGEYPWSDNAQDNHNNICLMQYYAPAQVWETKFTNMKNTLDNIERSSAKISAVNINASKIRELERKFSDFTKTQEQEIKNQLQVLEKNLEPLQQLPEQNKAWMEAAEQKTEAAFNEKIAQLEITFQEKLETMWQERLNVIQQKEQALDAKLHELDILPQKLQQLTLAFEKFAKEQENALARQKEEKDKNIQETIDKIDALARRIDVNIAELKQENLAFKSIMEKQNIEFSNLTAKTKQTDETTEKILQDHESRLSVLRKETTQKTTDLTSRVDRQEKSFEQIALNIQQVDKKHTELGNLRDNQLQRQQQQTEEQVATLKKQMEKDTKDIVELKNTTARIDNKTKEISASQEESLSTLKTQTDTELIGLRQQLEKHSQDLTQLNTNAQQMEVKNRDFESRFQALKNTESQQKKSNEQFDKEVSQLKNRALQLERTNEATNEKFKNFDNIILEQKKEIVKHQTSIEKLQQEKNALTKDLKDSQELLSKVSLKANDNQTTLTKTTQNIADQKQRQDIAMDDAKKRLTNLELAHKDTLAQIQTNSAQMRKGMIEVGEKLRDLFQSETVFGPLPGGEAGTGDKQKETEISKINVEEIVKIFKENQEIALANIEKSETKALDNIKQSMYGIITEINAKTSENIQKSIPGIIFEIKTKILTNIQESLPVHSIAQEIKTQVLANIFDSLPMEKLSADLRAKVLDNLDHVSKGIEEKVWQDINKQMSKKVDEIGKLALDNSTEAVKEKSVEILAQLCYSLAKTYEAYEQPELALECLKLALQYKKDYAPAKELLNEKWNHFHRPKDMVVIPTGTAILGNINDPKNPETTVTINIFYIDQYEVTQKDFAQFIQSNEYQNIKHWSEAGQKWLEQQQDKTKPEGWQLPTEEQEMLPVTNINFYEAEAYATWLGKRLPTSQEWEYAARGTDKRIYPWGNELSTQPYYANYRQLPKAKDGYAGLAPVQAFNQDCSAFHVIGMGGNASEWCSDTIKFEGSEREFQIVKGGSYMSQWFELYSSQKQAIQATERKAHIGFRCVKDMP